MTLKLTFSDMRSISRSKGVFSTDSPVVVFQSAAELLDSIDRRSVRLVGVSIHNLSNEKGRQISFEDIDEELIRRDEDTLQKLLDAMGERYGLDFAGNLDRIYKAETLHKTIEYMRRHKKP